MKSAAETKGGASAEARVLAEDRLQTSGLTREDGEALGLMPLDPLKVTALSQTFHPRPALYIPYYDPFHPGRPLAAKPGWPGFYRLRYLGASPPGFEDQTRKKSIKYTQAPGTGVCAYFAPIQAGWPAILADPQQPLIITEGELKAAKGCKEGCPTIGLGGVYSWKAASLGVPFLPELEAVTWPQRTVFIVFDSDSARNPDITAALWGLAEALAARGALPFLVTLPDLVEGGKTGLDDFLVARSMTDLIQLCDEAQPLTLAEALWSLNKEVVYVRDPGLVLVRESSQRLPPAAFRDHAYSNRLAARQELQDNGTIKLKPINPAKAWLSWPLRAETSCLTYRPGDPPRSETEQGWNLWAGWGVEPRRGDVAPFKKLIEHLFTGAQKGDMEWFVKWLAYPLQHPGTKMFSAAVLMGVVQGTGKSLIGYSMGKIYGKNFTEIKQDDLHGNFNEWAERRQFILADDVTGGMSRKESDLLKKIITQFEVRINPKHVAAYTIPDCMNYLFTTNQPDAFFIEDTDRRYNINEVRVSPLPDQFYLDYKEWLNGPGAAALFDWLLRVNLADFNPAAPARRTLAKERMIEDGRSELSSWVRGLIESPDAVLVLGDLKMGGDLFTNRELLSVYDPSGMTKVTANGLGRELRRARVPLVGGGKPQRGPDGRLERYYCLRNWDVWETARANAVAQHVAAARGVVKVDKRRKY